MEKKREKPPRPQSFQSKYAFSRCVPVTVFLHDDHDDHAKSRSESLLRVVLLRESLSPASVLCCFVQLCHQEPTELNQIPSAPPAALLFRHAAKQDSAGPTRPAASRAKWFLARATGRVPGGRTQLASLGELVHHSRKLSLKLHSRVASPA